MIAGTLAYSLTEVIKMIAEMVLEALDKRARRKVAKAYAKGLADARSWYRRRHDAEERGEPFPGSDEDTARKQTSD